MRYTAEELEVVRLSTKDPVAWALMPQFRERVFAFSVALGQAGGEEIVRRVDQGFVTDSDEMAAWMAVRKIDGKVVGHLLAQGDHFGGHPVGFVLQLEAEGLPVAFMRGIRDELDAWSRSKGHTRILMITKRFTFRAWWRIFGFQVFRAIMTREL